MITIQELRADAIRARDEHGNTDFYHSLNAAADTIEELCNTNDRLIRIAAEALAKVKELETR